MERIPFGGGGPRPLGAGDIARPIGGRPCGPGDIDRGMPAGDIARLGGGGPLRMAGLIGRPFGPGRPMAGLIDRGP